MEILTYPKDERILRSKCRQIYHDVDLAKKPGEVIGAMPFIRDEAMKLLDALIFSPTPGVGLASNQIGGCVRMFAMKRAYDGVHPAYQVFVDPVIVDRMYGEFVNTEGCLSFPSMCVNVRRSNCIEMKYVNLDGVICQESLSANESIIAQHEIDHLDGVLIIDRCSQ